MRYDPLQKYLQSLSGAAHEMSMVEIERVLGFPLPASARTYRQWWENSKDGQHYQCRAWMQAGWRAKPRLKRRTVLFERG